MYDRIAFGAGQVWYYRLTLAQMLLVAASAAVFQGGIMGVASTFPSEYTHACIIGQSAGGVVASVLQVRKPYLA